VTKDRQNWAGKTPKRQLFHGLESPFDWAGELKKIHEAREVELARTTSGEFSATASATPEAPSPAPTVVNPEPPSPTPSAKLKTEPPPVAPTKNKGAAKKEEGKIHLDWLKTCYSCKVAVWVGPPDAVVAGVCLACPLGSDWDQANNAPFCASCWETEAEVLTDLASEHRVTHIA
jgi:hypothetical protein